jgi:hypothetical protein
MNDGLSIPPCWGRFCAKQKGMTLKCGKPSAITVGSSLNRYSACSASERPLANAPHRLRTHSLDSVRLSVHWFRIGRRLEHFQAWVFSDPVPLTFAAIMVGRSTVWPSCRRPARDPGLGGSRFRDLIAWPQSAVLDSSTKNHNETTKAENGRSHDRRRDSRK